MAEIVDLSTTDANNNGSAANAGFAENMNYSAVNNAARALEGMIARWYADENGTLDSTGSSSAYALTVNAGISAYARGQVYRFEANHTNDGDVTLNVDTLGAKSVLNTNGNQLHVGAIQSGSVYTVVYDGTQFFCLDPTMILTGTWTPVFTCETTGDLSLAYSTQFGRYRRVGDMVYIEMRLAVTPTFTTASGRILITGLPVNRIDFAESSSLAASFPLQTQGIIANAMSGGYASAPKDLTCTISDAETNGIQIVQVDRGSGLGGFDLLDMTNVTSGTQVIIRCSGWYPAS